MAPHTDEQSSFPTSFGHHDPDLAPVRASSRVLTVDGPAPFRPCHFDETSGTTRASPIMRPASGAGEGDGVTIRRLTTSLRRLQARQAVLRQAGDTDSREAVETSDQIEFLFHSIALLKRCYRRSEGGAA